MSPSNEGNVLTSYDRQVLAAAVSHDDGKTWKGYREIARVHEGKQQVAYPFLTEARDDSFYCVVGGEAIRVPLSWLEKTHVVDRFTDGLQKWMTIACVGADAVPHPERKGAQVLRFRKPQAEVPAGASFNFPFGAQGQIKLRIKLKKEDRWPNRQHCYLCLTDFFSLPRLPAFVKGHPPSGWGTFPEGGRFKLRIAPDGEVSIAVRPGLFQDEFRNTRATLVPGRWHTLTLDWDCPNRQCMLALDGQSMTVLPQLSRAVGLCYLRLWMSAIAPEFEGLLIESVEVRSKS